MAKFIINNVLGLAPALSTRSNLKMGEAYHLATGDPIDPLTVPGIIQPGKSPATDLDPNNRISATLKDFTAYSAPAGNLYIIENGAKIHAIRAFDGNLDDAAFFSNYPLTISGSGTHGAHTTFIAQDIVAYNVGGTNYLFTSYNDNTDGDVARNTIDGGTTVFDYMSNSAAGGAVLGSFPHPMITPENGFMYIADGPSIHKFDGATGANGTFTPTVIDLPSSWVIQSMTDYKGYAWIYAIQSFAASPSSPANMRAGVFLWNYINKRSNEFTGFEKESPYIFDQVTEIGPIFVYDGIPHVFVYTAQQTTQLRRFTGTEFAAVWEEPGYLIPHSGGITKFYGHLMWGQKSGNGVYTFGRSSRNLPEVFNKYATVVGDCGIITVGSVGNLWAAYDIELRTLTRLPTSATFLTLVKELPKLSTIQSITVFYVPFSDSTNSELNLTFYRNFSSSPVSGSYQLTNPLDGARGWKYIQLGGKNFQNFNAIRMLFSYSLTSNATDTFRIYRIEVEYDEGTKKK